MNQYNSNGFGHPDPQMAESIADMFHERAEIEWSGEPVVRGGRDVAALWVDRRQKWDFGVIRAVGESPDRVRIEGTLEEWPSNERAGRSADAVQIWTRENGFDFRLRSLKVGPFKPER